MIDARGIGSETPARADSSRGHRAVSGGVRDVEGRRTGDGAVAHHDAGEGEVGYSDNYRGIRRVAVDRQVVVRDYDVRADRYGVADEDRVAGLGVGEPGESVGYAGVVELDLGSRAGSAGAPVDRATVTQEDLTRGADLAVGYYARSAIEHHVLTDGGDTGNCHVARDVRRAGNLQLRVRGGVAYADVGAGVDAHRLVDGECATDEELDGLRGSGTDRHASVRRVQVPVVGAVDCPAAVRPTRAVDAQVDVVGGVGGIVGIDD